LCNRERRAVDVVALAAAVAVGIVPAPHSSPVPSPELREGRAPTAEELRPSVEAAFPHESYAPGTTAALVFYNSARGVSIQVFQIGSETAPTVGDNELQGLPVSGRSLVGAVRRGTSVSVSIGGWPTGLYFAQLTAADGRVGFAPFVLRPRRLGEHRVAIVMPTMTWQAYNLRDDNGDGKGDSWYADWNHHTVRLDRPFLSRGVPYNFRVYDLPFLHWLAWYHHGVDVLSDADLEHVASGDALRRAYRLVVFPGHHEYVTTHEYDVVQRYRDLGGHLMFLSANDFFRRVDLHANTMTMIGLWRDLGRPEAALIGVEYLANDRGTHRGPWVVRHAEELPWLFAGSGLRDGMTIGSAGIEIDRTAPASPKGVKVLAEIPNLFGPGYTAQMTYYETPRGGQVFAAGAFTLAGSVLQSNIGKLIDNLWHRLG
jgi:hypothetical protein